MCPNRASDVGPAAPPPAADAGCALDIPSAVAPQGLSARVRRWRSHFSGPRDLMAFLAIGLALLRAPRRLSRRGLAPTLARLDARSGHRRSKCPDEAADLARAQRLARYADVWLRRLRLRNPCLRRTLVLFGRLRHAGLPVHFCLGVRTGAALSETDPLDGHAWLELHERPLLEPSPLPSQFVTTFRYPADARRAASGR